MEILQGVFDVLLRASWQASVLALMVAATQWLFRRRLAPSWRHALWLLVFVRLVLPVTPPSSFSLFNYTSWGMPSGVVEPDRHALRRDRGETDAAVRTENEPAGEVVSSRAGAVVAAPARAASDSAPAIPWSWREGLLALWLLAAAALAVRLMWLDVRFSRTLRHAQLVTDLDAIALLSHCREAMGLRTNVRLVQTSLIQSPALHGLLRPALLIPDGMLARFSPAELRYVFLHELAHMKRRDMWMNWLVHVFRIIHWFNPVLWWAFRRMAVDRELATDALALSMLETKENTAYGEAIIKLLENLARPATLPGLVGLLEDKSSMERRIAMIAHYKPAAKGMLIAAAVFLALGLVALTDAQSNREPVQLPAGSATFVDAKTGVEFTKVKALTGPSDIIGLDASLNISPNGKFLLDGVQVIPLDGSPVFKLVDMERAGRGVWSPDGRKVAFYAGAIWLINVDPDTARPRGSAKKLINGDYYFFSPVVWTPDSERFIFSRLDREHWLRAWICSTKDGTLAEAKPGSPILLPSPDGSLVAYNDGLAGRKPFSTDQPLYVRPSGGGAAKVVHPKAALISWSADNTWLICRDQDTWKLLAVRVSDGHAVSLIPPKEAGQFVGQSPDGRWLYFYQTSREDRFVLKVVADTGGEACQIGGDLLDIADQHWSPDSQRIMAQVESLGGESELVSLGLSGGEPVRFTRDTKGGGPFEYLQLSPDCTSLLYGIKQDSKGYDLWLAPFAWKEMRVTGPAALLFRGWSEIRGVSGSTRVWSPDGTRIAIMKDDDIWIASARGGEPVCLRHHAPDRADRWPQWSPDGLQIAFCDTNVPLFGVDKPAANATVVVQVISVLGGQARTLLAVPPSSEIIWTPDSRSLTVIRERGIWSMPVQGGEPVRLLDLESIGADAAEGLRWSPDGKKLLFQAGLRGMEGNLFVYRSDERRTTKIVQNVWSSYQYWSPDSQWISYDSETSIKTRPTGVLWKMDIKAALAKLAK